MVVFSDTGAQIGLTFDVATAGDGILVGEAVIEASDGTTLILPVTLTLVFDTDGGCATSVPAAAAPRCPGR